MTINKIPQSIREIINVFIRLHFESLTYNNISSSLNKDVNTIVQRINRHPQYFQIKEGRPNRITLKKGLKEIYFYRDKNQCQICRKTINSENLVIRHKDPHMKDKFDWENIVTCCDKCKDKDLTKRSKRQPITKGKQIYVWEYKEIKIREILRRRNFFNEIMYTGFGELENQEDDEGDYFEFNELNGQGWFHLLDDNDKKSSLTLADVLNYFGDQGWELVEIHYPFSEEESEYICLFKSKKVKVVNNEK